MERQAAIAACVLVPALERLASAAKEQGAGCHQFSAGASPAGGTAILKCAGKHDGDREAGVAFFERTILRAGGAHHIGNTPATPLSQEAMVGTSWSAMSGSGSQSLF